MQTIEQYEVNKPKFNERIQFLTITQNVIYWADKITVPPADVDTVVQLTRDQDEGTTCHTRSLFIIIIAV
jgi:hypothetical protein